MQHSSRHALIIWLASLIGFVAYILITAGDLPEKVAQHFNASGVANGWASRESYVTLTLVMGVGMSLFIIGLLYSTRFLPASMLNVPNAEYWRKPENYSKACSLLLTYAFYFSSMLLVWNAALHALLVKANQIKPPHLDGKLIVIFTVALLVASVGWVIALLLVFLKKASADVTTRV